MYKVLLINHACSLHPPHTQIIIPYRGDHYDVLRLKLVGDLGQVLFLPYHLCDEEAIRKAVKYSDIVINLVGRDWETRNFSFEQVSCFMLFMVYGFW